MNIFSIFNQKTKNKKQQGQVHFFDIHDFLPEFPEHPGSINKPWHEIPLGITRENGPDGAISSGQNVELSIDVLTNPHTLITGLAHSGKSLMQHNFITHCIQHPDDWRFVGVDLLRVKLTPYESHPIVLGVATNLQDSLEVFIYAQEEMDKRYAEMESADVSNFKNLPKRTPALMVLVDFASELFVPKGINTEEGKEEDAIRLESYHLALNIARIGGAAGIYLVIATDFAGASLLDERFLMEFGNRIVMEKPSYPTYTGIFCEPRWEGRGRLQVEDEFKTFQGYYPDFPRLD